MSRLTQDIVYESQAVRVRIESWLLRYGAFVASGFLILSGLLFFASVRTATMRIQVLAITQQGEPHEIPAYATAEHAQAAARQMNSAAGLPATGPTGAPTR